MIDALRDFDDPELFEPYFHGPSWNTWRAVLKGAFGSQLTKAEQKIFQQVAERDPPGHRVPELWVIAGRRSGKDSAASFIASHIAVAGDFSELRPGEKAVVLCLATDKDQAGIVLRYIRGYFDKVPALRAMVLRNTADGIELTNGAEIIVTMNSYRSVRGRTYICVIFDEVAFWRNEDFANPAGEIYAAVVPGMVTYPEAMLIGISTPHRRSGLLFDTWERSYGKNDPDCLVIKGPSTVFNPTLLQPRQQRVISRQMERDPEKAGSEWLAEWRTDLSDLVSKEALDRCVMSGRLELPAVSGLDYQAYVDPSGGSADSMTLCIVHRDESGRAVVDAVREARAPFNPKAVVAEFSFLLKQYRVRTVIGDRYAGEWPRAEFSEHLITYEVNEKNTSTVYLEFLPILNSGRCELPDHSRMLGQFLCLERRTSPSNKDLITHPRGTHDDIATAVAGACVLAAGEPDPMEIWRRLGRADGPRYYAH